MDQGDYDRATALLEESLASCRALDERLWAALVRHSLGVVAYEQDDIEPGGGVLRRSAAGVPRVRQPWYTGVALASLARIARARGDYARAAALYAESLTLRWERVGDKMGIAGSLRGLASIAALTGHYERAARLYGAAEALREAVGAPFPRHHASPSGPWPGLGPAWASRRSPRRGRRGGRCRWRRRSPRRWPRRTVRPPMPADDVGLTPREAEVLRLLPQGLTNREIGERLFVTERTAAKHVENILAKLGVGSRVEAAAFAVAHGVV